MAHVTKVKLGDITTWRSGGTPPKQDKKYWNGSIPWISAKSLTSRKILSSETFITQEGLEAGSRLAGKNSILLLVRGSGLFHDIPIGIVEKPVAFNQDIKAIEADESKVVPYYLLYWLIGNKNLLNTKLESTGIGAGKFDTAILQGLELELPSLEDQEKIVRIARCWDDKMELNNQINHTLEQMAQALFKKYFLDNIDSENLPTDWRIGRFSDYINVLRGLSYKGSGLCGKAEGIPMHNLNSVREGGGYKNEGIKYYKGEFRERHQIKPWDIIVTNTEQGHKYLLIGYPAIVPNYFGGIGIFTQHIYKLDLKNEDLTTQYLYYLILQHSIREQIIACTNGTTVNMLAVDGLEKPEFLVPPKEVLIKFSNVVKSIWLKQESNYLQCETLRNHRDSILPKLMNGEIKIKEEILVD